MREAVISGQLPSNVATSDFAVLQLSKGYPIFRNSHGRLFLLVVHYAVDDVVSLGWIEQCQSARERPSCAYGLRLIALRSNVLIAERMTFEPFVDVEAAVGKKLFRVNLDGERAGAGVATAVDAPVFIREDDGTVRTYFGAIEVQAVGPDPFALSGDAGAAVVDENNGLIGILLARHGETFSIVPVAEISKTFNLGPAGENDVWHHNAAVQSSFGSATNSQPLDLTLKASSPQDEPPLIPTGNGRFM